MEDTRDNSGPNLAGFSSRVQAVVDVNGPVDFIRDHDPEGDAFLTAFVGAPISSRMLMPSKFALSWRGNQQRLRQTSAANQ